MKTKLFILMVAVWAPLALGHHSTTMYNMANPATLEGTVKSFDWINPHSLLHLEVPNSEGKLEEWVVEIHSVAIMVRRGYTKDYFKPGDRVTVVGGPMKDGSHMIRDQVLWRRFLAECHRCHVGQKSTVTLKGKNTGDCEIILLA
jgi:hypothetical protein